MMWFNLDNQQQSQFGSGPHRSWVGAIVAIAASVIAPVAVRAQALPPCQPPAVDEYLLLVVSATEAQRQAVRSLVPSGTTTMICNYFDDTVVRVGGFTNAETAGAWAQYLGGEVAGVQAFVARPAAATLPADTNVGRYNPRALEEGYALLVDYFDQPEVALDLRQTLGQAIGVAVYHEEPYLLITATPDLQVASQLLRQLSDREFAPLIVDSRHVIVLSTDVEMAPTNAVTAE